MLEICTIRDGNIIEISSSKNIELWNVDGITQSDALVNTSQKIGGKGAVVVSTAIRPRNIVISFAPQHDVVAGRNLIYDQFPVGEEIELLFRSTHNVTISGTVESVRGDLFEDRQIIKISIICPFPYFRDYEQEYTMLLSAGMENYFDAIYINAGCEINIVSPTPFRMVSISHNAKVNSERYNYFAYFSAKIQGEQVQTLTISSIEGKKGLIGHPISCVDPISDWIDIKKGTNDIWINLYKEVEENGSTHLEQFTAEEYADVNVNLKEKIYYGGL